MDSVPAWVWSVCPDMRGDVLTAEEYDRAVREIWQEANGRLTTEDVYTGLLILVQRKIEAREWLRWKANAS